MLRGPGRTAPRRSPAAIEAGAGGLLETDGDLSEALHAILDQETVDLGKAPEAEGLGEVLREFREKVAQEVSSSDYRTHYELGIAYKEMGLIDEAIAELENASADRAHFVECCAMLALCYRQKELPAKACDWYVKAIRSELGTADQRIGLEFELAEACLEMGDIARAREAFRRVAGIDRNYRNVAARLVELERMA